MVFVKVRETYDLHTIKNKISVIAVHTPNPRIIQNNFPGLLMQCKAYRPYSCDVRLACASMLPVDPLGVGTSEGDVSPEDLFNPLLYTAMSNFGMSQLEARINAISQGATTAGQDLAGNTAAVDADSLTSMSDEFNVYYGILSNSHGWKKASPQAGLEMRGLRPLVYERLYNVGESLEPIYNPAADGSVQTGITIQSIRGNGKPMPMINTTGYTSTGQNNPFKPDTPGDTTPLIGIREQEVPWINAVVAAILVPPSRLHQLFYRMVVEWTIEFSGIRPIGEITSWASLAALGELTHFKSYDYSSTKEALTGDSSSILDHDTSMVSANVDVTKVM